MLNGSFAALCVWFVLGVLAQIANQVEKQTGGITEDKLKLLVLELPRPSEVQDLHALDRTWVPYLREEASMHFHKAIEMAESDLTNAENQGADTKSWKQQLANRLFNRPLRSVISMFKCTDTRMPPRTHSRTHPYTLQEIVARVALKMTTRC